MWRPIADLPIRFVVGRVDGLTSNSWRVWTGGDDTIYVACRDNYQELKASLHPGRWQFGLTSEAHRRNQQGLTTRHWERWDPPSEFAPGAMLALRLMFVHSELAVPEGLRVGRRWDEPLYVEPSTGFEQTVVSLFITVKGVDLRSPIGPTIELARVPLHTDQELQLIVHGEPVTDEFRAQLWTSHIQARATMSSAMTGTSRLLLFGRHDNGARFVTELNAVRAQPDPLFSGWLAALADPDSE